jgi:hypothetical protein
MISSQDAERQHGELRDYYQRRGRGIATGYVEDVVTGRGEEGHHV